MVMARRVPARAPTSFRLASTPRTARLVSMDWPKVAEVDAVLSIDSCRSANFRLERFIETVIMSPRVVAWESGFW